MTFNDAKRQSFFADLANPDIPLHKLGKSVPHGAKGHDLLDLLHSHQVSVSRAVWLLRVFGANETVRQVGNIQFPRLNASSLYRQGSETSQPITLLNIALSGLIYLHCT
jgi:hypothetical protein